MFEQVLMLRIEGLTQLEIAERLGLTHTRVRLILDQHRKIKQRKRISEHRVRVKKKAIDYSGGKCLRCGYNNCIDALVFHHVDPSKKETQIASGNIKSWDRIKVEIDKTIMLCSVCHIEFHAGSWKITNEFEAQKKLRLSYIDKPLLRYGIDINLANRLIQAICKMYMWKDY